MIKPFAFISCSFFCQVGFSQSESIITDRPDITESAEVVPAGWLQLEHGFQYSDYNNPIVDYATTLVRWGLNAHTELRLAYAPSIELHENLKGETVLQMQSFSMGLKSILYSGNYFNCAAISSGGSTITREEEDLYADPNFELLIAAAADINQFWTLSVNTGGTLSGDDGYVKMPFSLSNGIAIGDKFGYFAELFVEDLTDFEASVDMGFTYLINTNIQVDVSGGYQFDYDVPFISTGFAYRFDL